MRWLHVAGLFLALLSLALLLIVSAQAGAAKPHTSTVRVTAKPVRTLAMDGPRVAYMRVDRKVFVWNVATGTTSVVKGNYPSKGHHSAWGGRGEVAIAGERIAVITRFAIGNSQETQERLFAATAGGPARQLGKMTDHVTNPFDGGSESGLSTGRWIAGVVGSGNLLAVSTWKASDSVSTDERLSLVTPKGLRTIVSGPGAIVAESANSGHIAVLRSTGAWPADDVGPATATPSVGIYSAGGTLLNEISPGPYSLDAGLNARIEIALSGNELVVLTRIPSFSSPGTTAIFEIYDWTTGSLEHTWTQQPGRDCDAFAVSGRLAAYSTQCGVSGGTERLHLLDLTTGKDVLIAHAPGNGGYVTAMDSRGLVYSVNPWAASSAHGKLVFVPMAKLLAMLK